MLQFYEDKHNNANNMGTDYKSNMLLDFWVEDQLHLKLNTDFSRTMEIGQFLICWVFKSREISVFSRLLSLESFS